MNKFYITTAIDYVNDVIHVGHAFQKIAADILARYYRIRLGEENVFFLTGTDEYGQKAEKAAAEANLTPKEYVQKISNQDKNQQDVLNISYNRFIETTDDDHTKVAQEIWHRVEVAGDIYLGEFSGLYCAGCEAYYNEGDLVGGHCQFHPNLEIQKITEKNFFFKWSSYQNFLIELLEKNPDFVFPESRRQEMLNFAKRGIQDIPISRTSFKWGVPVLNQADHVMYVWFDALTNYLTGVGFLQDPEKFRKFWPADIHILGKDNVRWHALLWPAILKSAGLKLPKQILVNGFLSLNGQKISKSLGNIIRPSDWVKKYSADAVRYYLLRYTTLTEDSDISEEKLKIAYSADLANGLGNLIARVAKLCEQNNIKANPSSNVWCADLEKYLAEFKFNEALNVIWELIAQADKKINQEKPWQLQGKKLQEVLEDLVKRIQAIVYNLQPFLPQTAEKILKQFSGQIKSAPPLFPRLG
ncbi:methionine--tRNA ligase [Candidatus Daviesbacteria bacterium]|nr:methionine--tRNA ligase [Candidatus Daviesbacteria bacterium]